MRFNVEGLWLLARDSLEAMAAAADRFELTLDEAGVEAFLQRVSSGRTGDGELFIRDGDTARVPIVGNLTKSPSYFFSFFGGGSVYGDLIQAIEAADGDASVNRIVLEIDSPGGEVDGFFDLASAIRDTATRIEAEVTDLAASAAYGLAAQADLITVNNPMATVGSVGIVTRRFVDDSVVLITSTDAPNKAPDAGTTKGRAAIRSELDEIHNLFAGLIAEGRTRATGETVTVDDVNVDFGRGGVVLAESALAAGMIDAIASGSSSGATNLARPNTGDQMTLAELQAAHPELFAQIAGGALVAGVLQERARCQAHVEMAAATGAGLLGSRFILDGSDFSDPRITARYTAAGINRRERDDRAADDDTAPTSDPATGAPGGNVDADANTAAIFATARANAGLAPTPATS